MGNLLMQWPGSNRCGREAAAWEGRNFKDDDPVMLWDSDGGGTRAQRYYAGPGFKFKLPLSGDSESPAAAGRAESAPGRRRP